MPDSSPPVERGTPPAVSVRGAGALELLLFKDDGMAVHPLPAHGTVSIGRAADNDVCVDHGSVSRRHAVLHVGATLRLEDLTSANGTFFYDRTRREEESALIDDRTLPSSGGDTLPEPVRIQGRPAEVRVGAHILLGSLVVSIRHGGPREGALLEGAASTSRPGGDSQVVVASPAMGAIHERARLAAESRTGVLLVGESGVGKETVARTIHALSPRAGKPFLVVNCAGPAAPQLEAELFGSGAEAAPGAAPARPGLLEAADGGTVYLAEVGDLSMALQTRLLQLIEERAAAREGGPRPGDLDLRFLAASSRDLEFEIARGNFHRDLFVQLAGLTLPLPPLRERKTELGALARTFLRRASDELDRAFAPVLSEPALALLQRYAWPGNVRELRQMLVRAVVLCPGNAIGAEHLPPRLSRWAPTPAAPMAAIPRQRLATLPGVDPRASAQAAPTQQLTAIPQAAPTPQAPPAPTPTPSNEAVDRRRVIAMLTACSGDQILAAVKLGITRRRLLELLEEPEPGQPARKKL